MLQRDAPLDALPPALADTLQVSLLDSRQRWRAFGAIAADLLFETDPEGRLTFLAPDIVLGWPSAALVGHSAASFLLQPDDAAQASGPGAGAPPDPFGFILPVRDHIAWVRDMRGAEVCLSISSAPLFDTLGHHAGTRGAATDVTERERRAAANAAALRRSQVLDHILGQMREEVLAPRMMQAVLDALIGALGGEGAAVLDLTLASPDSAPPPPWPVLHRAGADPSPIVADALGLLCEQQDAAATDGILHGMSLLACPASTRFGERAGLVVWRRVGLRDWDADDHTLAASVTGVVRIVLEHEAIQRELARQARTDPLTGLLNRRAFLDEAARRIDRLDREDQPGTLMFVDLDRLKQLNDRLGHEAGDAALLRAAELLRRTVRPSDLVARLGGDEFALWLDGLDELTAAERAEQLRIDCPLELAGITAGSGPGENSMTMSIGIACRRPGHGEELDSLIARADQAMYDVKRAGRGHWRVSHAGPAP